MTDVTLRPWSADDLDLLRRANTPELMDQLGGVETDEQVMARHGRYLRLRIEGTGHQFRIAIPGHPEGVGIVGYWQREHDGDLALEAGWSVEAESGAHEAAEGDGEVGEHVSRLRRGGRELDDPVVRVQHVAGRDLEVGLAQQREAGLARQTAFEAGLSTRG